MRLDLSQVRRLGAWWISRAALGEAYRRLYETSDGKLVLDDIMRQGGMIDDVFVGGATDVTAYNSGKRALALHVLRATQGGLSEVVALELQRQAESLNSMGEN